jgi:hypothetical protein
LAKSNIVALTYCSYRLQLIYLNSSSVMLIVVYALPSSYNHKLFVFVCRDFLLVAIKQPSHLVTIFLVPLVDILLRWIFNLWQPQRLTTDVQKLLHGDRIKMADCEGGFMASNKDTVFSNYTFSSRGIGSPQRPQK